MPELPEVEIVRRGLNRVTCMQIIKGGEVRLARTIAYPFSIDDFLRGLQGTQVADWQRRGKYLLGSLVHEDEQPAGWLGVHLRMTGQLLWVKPETPLQTHTRVRLFLGTDQELRFVDQRTFGQMWWVPTDQSPEQVITGLAKLGPEPFDPEFSVPYLQNAFQRRQRPIKNCLLDQRLVAGIGNIYADEALFLSGIRPMTRCAELERPDLEKLYQAIQTVLLASIEAGGTTFSDFRDIQGINGNYGGVAWVYDRAGQPCRVCGTALERLKLAGRSAHYCPQCQR